MSGACRLIVFVCLLWPATVAAQQPDVLTGRVTDPAGQPIMGARVEALSVQTELSTSVVTGRDGRYLMLFPDGGGLYVLRVSFIGMGDDVRPVVRAASEEILVTDVGLAPEAISLDQITVSVLAAVEGEPGAETIVLSQDVLNRLPLPDLEPETVALLSAGVIGTEVDTLSGRMGFSVGGMSDALNQVTLDGVVLDGDMQMGLPEEGVRLVQVTTNTFDASRGGFAGGQVSMTSARGNNQASGSLSYRLDSHGLQLRAMPTANPFTRHNLGGSWSGPMVENRLFYNASFQLTRNDTQRFALAAGDPLAAQRSGVSADSIARFMSILEGYDAFPVDGQTGAYSQLSSDLRLQGRIDWNIAQDSERTHSLSVRVNTNINAQDSTRISSLDLLQHGGETGRDTRQLSLNLSSRFGRNWTNALSLSYSDNSSDAVAYIEIPEGQVRVTSEFDDGTRGSRNVIFGGNRNMPSEASGRTLAFSEELSLVLPIAGQVHRVKVGGSWDANRSLNRSTANLFGSFRYMSLGDFEANRPDRFERTLTEREEESGRISTGLFFSDTWRLSQPLELTLGLRWDYSRLRQRPDYNPAIEEVFGLRTDITPSSAAWSPRLGFSYTLPQARGSGRRSLTGGIGYFAGRAPTNIFSAAVRQTGLPNAELTLICIGDAVPTPDWDLYREQPDAVPSACADGEGGTPSQSTRAPSVTVVRPDQPLPGSIRLDLGYRTPLPLGLNGNFRYQYSLGRGLWGYRDLNLDESHTTRIGAEERLFFGDPAAIARRSGAVSLASSRLDPAFANVYEVASGLRSVAHQFSAQLSGTLPPRVRTNLNYTLAFGRDQGSGSLQGVTTAGNPNEVEWAGSNTRRHNLNVTLTLPLTPSVEVSANSRIQSGAPFTPLVNRDVNGDGLRNDRAFVFDPHVVQDSALANGMTRLLAGLPGGVRSCIASQIGTVARRNSCTGGWTQTLNVSANFRPMLPTLQRRLTITANLQNVLTGLDYALHGSSGMKGWGEGQRPNANLLEVRGFDAQANGFIYEVNEGFGQDNRGPEAFRNAFALTLSARMTLGGNPAQASRGFINTPAGGRGGAAGAGPSGGAAAAVQGFPLPALVAILRAQQAEEMDADSVVATLLANPLARVLSLADTLDLSEEQTAALLEGSATLQTLLDARTEPLTEGLWAIGPLILDGSSGFFGPQSEVQQLFEGTVRPQVDGAREERTAALRSAQEQLSPDQWARLPAELRSLVAEGAGAGRATQPQAFSALGTLDRMLANPLLVLLDLKDILRFTQEQVGAIERASTALQEKLNARRETLGSRFDGVAPADQARVFQEIQPGIEEGRGEIRAALREAEAILTAEQWGQVPAAVRDPFVAPAAQGAPSPGTR